MSGVGAPALAGRRVLIARPEGRASALATALGRRGADVVVVPVLEFDVVRPGPADRELLAGAGAMDAVVYVSPAAVEAAAALAGAALAGAPTFAVGATTARVLRETLGVEAAVPSQGVGAEALLAHSPLGRLGAGARVIIVRGTEGREVLAQRLRERGAEVHEVVVYRPVVARLGASALGALLGDRPPELMIAASCGAWRALGELLARAGRAAWLETPVLLCSERHRACAAAAGFRRVAAVASDPGVAATLEALERAWGRDT